MYEDRDYILIPLGIIIIKSQDRPFSSRLSFCDCVTEVIVLWYSISYFIYIRGKLGLFALTYVALVIVTSAGACGDSRVATMTESPV